MIIKCKMCGGDIEFVPGATYGTCEYCGSTSTIPKADDEMALNRYNRANHFRRQCEFDKALAAYEKLLEKDDTDAEAHWGAAISRYGIEYVEDPATGKRIPTCHRLQVTSILADADYLAAVEHAPDSESRRLYEEQAAQIAEIQKGILAISANEKPYDVFICYKETDDNGQRTRDSQWAQDVYYGLTDAGYKVFFSRITLEDKLGQQYEPYIFAALNSAKVMVVIGSKPEYFNAVWVKNEWSRYLALMANDRKRLLIPCYRDMDPYDLPEELSALQSQDMSKIGFMQDLLRGVKKVLSVDKQPEPVRQVVQTTAASAAVSPGVTSLLERAYLFMEDGDFNSAAEYLDRVLDIDPKFAPAYAAKACATFGFNKEADLADATFLYEDNADWQKALRFADAAQKRTYQGYIDAVKTHVRKQIRDYAYDCAVAMTLCDRDADSLDEKLTAELAEYQQMCHTSHGQHSDGNRRKGWQKNEATFKQDAMLNEPYAKQQSYLLAAKRFDAIGDDEAKECAKQCRNLAEQARQKAIYQDAILCMRETTLTRFRIALNMFESIPNYKDAKECAEKCRQGIESIQSNAYAEAVDAMQKAGDSSFKWTDAILALENEELNGYRDVNELRKQAQRRYNECYEAEEEMLRRQEAAGKTRLIRNEIIIVAIIVVVIATYFVATKVIIPNNKYNDAVALREAGQYEEAAETFAELGDYSDSATQVKATYYAEGETKREAQDWDGAVIAFTNAGDYNDAVTQVCAMYYASGESKRALQDWNGAVTAFTNAGSYSDAITQVSVTYYAEGEAKRAASDWSGAVTAFSNAGSYSDAATQVSATYYTEGEAKRAAQDWDAAVTAFKNAGAYSDASTQIAATYYAKGEALRAAQDWDGAITAFSKATIATDTSGCISVEKSVTIKAFAEDITVYVAVVKGVIYSLRVDASTQTAGLGQKCADDEFVGQFIGKSGPFTLGNNIDAVTSATITSQAVVDAVNSVCEEPWTSSSSYYGDAATQITETRYQQAQSLLNSKDYAAAKQIYTLLSGYKDTTSKLKKCEDAITKLNDEKFTVGNYVKFGTYPQTAKGYYSSPIEWLVLDRVGNKALLISRYSLDVKPYNTEGTSVTWETCTLRTWLNSTFMNKAFTSEEQKAILTTKVDNSKNQCYSDWCVNGGDDTYDKIFLLSCAETTKYFSATNDDKKNIKARVAPTAYAIAQGASSSSKKQTADGDDAWWWWLRSPGDNQVRAAIVAQYGSLGYNNVNNNSTCVRPALWVNIQSGVF